MYLSSVAQMPFVLFRYIREFTASLYLSAALYFPLPITRRSFASLNKCFCIFQKGSDNNRSKNVNIVVAWGEKFRAMGIFHDERNQLTTIGTWRNRGYSDTNWTLGAKTMMHSRSRYTLSIFFRFAICFLPCSDFTLYLFLFLRRYFSSTRSSSRQHMRGIRNISLVL